MAYVSIATRCARRSARLAKQVQKANAKAARAAARLQKRSAGKARRSLKAKTARNRKISKHKTNFADVAAGPINWG